MYIYIFRLSIYLYFYFERVGSLTGNSKLIWAAGTLKGVKKEPAIKLKMAVQQYRMMKVYGWSSPLFFSFPTVFALSNPPLLFNGPRADFICCVLLFLIFGGMPFTRVICCMLHVEGKKPQVQPQIFILSPNLIILRL